MRLTAWLVRGVVGRPPIITTLGIEASRVASRGVVATDHHDHDDDDGRRWRAREGARYVMAMPAVMTS